MTQPPAVRAPLLRLVVSLVDDGGTVASIRARLHEDGIEAPETVIRAALDEAMQLGLVRVATVRRDDTVYARTSLGRRSTEGELAADEAARLRDLEELRTDLSATIAHELRTPLTAIRTSVGLLLAPDSHPTDEQRRTLLETIERNADRMQRVVGDILDLARFRSGRIALQLRRFDAVALAESAIASLAPVAAQRDLRVELHAPTRPVHVFADHRRLEQALVNLLSNAQRYSPDGGRVRVDVERRGDEVALAVRDQGPGIPAADLPRLFERFFVGRSDRGGPRDGVGLGLPTTLAITQAHGGRIDVETAPGAGATLTILVPAGGPEPVETEAS